MQRQEKPFPGSAEPDDFWLDIVTRPELNRSKHVNFENALSPENRFDPGARGFSRKNAWWLAEAALLAYWPDDKARGIYTADTGLECICLSQDATQCHLAIAKDFAMIAFRGTQSNQWKDLFDDACFVLTPWQGDSGGQVHLGFKAAFERIRPLLQEAIDRHAPDRPLWITGHSLGGTLAVLAADALRNVQGVYTAGCPRVGDHVFASRFDQRFAEQSFRYVNDTDIVTHVPPGLGPYAHVEAVRGIDERGEVSEGESSLLHFLDAIFGSPALFLHVLKGGLPLPDALKDHAPVLYAIHTWNDLVKHP
jgi:hypothetical protein